MGFILINHSLENMSKVSLEPRVELVMLYYSNIESAVATMKAYKSRNNLIHDRFSQSIAL